MVFQTILPNRGRSRFLSKGGAGFLSNYYRDHISNTFLKNRAKNNVFRHFLENVDQEIGLTSKLVYIGAQSALEKIKS